MIWEYLESPDRFETPSDQLDPTFFRWGKFDAGSDDVMHHRDPDWAAEVIAELHLFDWVEPQNEIYLFLRDPAGTVLRRVVAVDWEPEFTVREPEKT